MLLLKNRVSVAKIEVEQIFCETCSVYIKEQLQSKSDVKNIRLYPIDALITFSFTNASKLSWALNVLSDIGYYEKGERPSKNKFRNTGCC